MFSLPPPAGGEESKAVVEGATDEKPIPLPGVTVSEFNSLLKLFYDGYVQFRAGERLFVLYSTQVPTRLRLVLLRVA